MNILLPHLYKYTKVLFWRRVFFQFPLSDDTSACESRYRYPNASKCVVLCECLSTEPARPAQKNSRVTLHSTDMAMINKNKLELLNQTPSKINQHIVLTSGANNARSCSMKFHVVAAVRSYLHLQQRAETRLRQPCSCSYCCFQTATETQKADMGVMFYSHENTTVLVEKPHSESYADP